MRQATHGLDVALGVWGRLIVGNAGVLVTSVIYAKTTLQCCFVIVDAGDERFHPADRLRARATGSRRWRKPAGRKRHRSDVVGPARETGDILAKDVALPEPRPGDLLVIESTGAYGAVMASTYNTRLPVARRTARGDQFSVIRPLASLTATSDIPFYRVPDWLGYSGEPMSPRRRLNSWGPHLTCFSHHAMAHPHPRHEFELDPPAAGSDGQVWRAQARARRERLWPAAWPVVGVVGLFCRPGAVRRAAAAAGLGPCHALAGFAAALLWFGFRAIRQFAMPDEAAARRRLEQASGLAHRPLVSTTCWPRTPVIPMPRRCGTCNGAAWRRRPRRLRVGWPAPGLARRDPWSLRGALLLVLVIATAIGWTDAGERPSRALTPEFATGRPKPSPSTCGSPRRPIPGMPPLFPIRIAQRPQARRGTPPRRAPRPRRRIPRRRDARTRAPQLLGQ